MTKKRTNTWLTSAGTGHHGLDAEKIYISVTMYEYQQFIGPDHRKIAFMDLSSYESADRTFWQSATEALLRRYRRDTCKDIDRESAETYGCIIIDVRTDFYGACM